jgi:hypothetical protein
MNEAPNERCTASGCCIEPTTHCFNFVMTGHGFILAMTGPNFTSVMTGLGPVTHDFAHLDRVSS